MVEARAIHRRPSGQRGTGIRARGRRRHRWSGGGLRRLCADDRCLISQRASQRPESPPTHGHHTSLNIQYRIHSPFSGSVSSLPVAEHRVESPEASSAQLICDSIQ
nr:hypothetical protein CFP56_09189 [Quercus suber]